MKQNTPYFYSNGKVLLKKYRVEAPLGRGTFAEVYRVTHLGLGVARALKILHHGMPGLGGSEFNDYVSRFELEAQIGAQLNSPNPHVNLIQIHNIETQGDLLVMEMEYASGGSLSERIQKSKERDEFISISEALKIALDVAEGLAVIHARDIIHRDLKPNNILFDNKGNAKVADLGLAQVPGGPSLRSKLSAPQPHPGTPGYKSPEHTNSSEILKPPSDIYCLGLVMFEMLTGRNYSYAEPGTRASALRADIPKWLDDLLASMLAKEPEKRPWDEKKVAALIRTGMYEVDKPAVLKSKANSQIVYWIGGFAVLVVGIVFLSSLNNPSKIKLTNTVQVVSSPSSTLRASEIPSQSTPIVTIAPTSLPAEMTDARGVSMVLVSGSEIVPFYMDKYEVTNALYKLCVNVGACSPPSNSNRYGLDDYLNYPVVYVNKSMGQTFCDWRDAELPSWDQWHEAAVTGIDNHFPLGNENDCIYANIAHGIVSDSPVSQGVLLYCVGSTVPVGSYEQGRSVFDIYDLVGNVSEWVGEGAVGGSWTTYSRDFFSEIIYTNLESAQTNYIGFRCAKDATPSAWIKPIETEPTSP